VGRRGGQQGIAPAQMGLMLAPLSCSPASFRLPDDWTYSSMMVWIARSVALVALVKRAFSCESAGKAGKPIRSRAAARNWRDGHAACAF